MPLKLITTTENLPAALAASISPEEKKYIDELKNRGMPFGVMPHFASLAGPEKDDPIRRQFIPDPREALPDPFSLDDPLGECHYRAAPRLVHQYRDRALLLTTSACAGYCRYCFRRVWMGGKMGNGEWGRGIAALGIGEVESGEREEAFEKQDVGDLQRVYDYLRGHAEIREILLSGGDPLTLSNAKLCELFQGLRAARPGILIRVGTRVPITDPLRLDSETIAILNKFRPLRLSVHINHPRELSGGGDALDACVSAGIPVHVQTVLLRGINDTAELLAGLFRDCLDLGLTPYYLFQLDLAPGTAHFRVPLTQGLAIYRQLAARISGLGLPAYALDLPGGGGKIRLHENVICGERVTDAGRIYVLKDASGREWGYPAE